MNNSITSTPKNTLKLMLITINPMAMDQTVICVPNWTFVVWSYPQVGILPFSIWVYVWNLILPLNIQWVPWSMELGTANITHYPHPLPSMMLPPVICTLPPSLKWCVLWYVNLSWRGSSSIIRCSKSKEWKRRWGRPWRIPQARVLWQVLVWILLGSYGILDPC